MLTELARGDLRVRELVALLGEPQSLVSYHLRLLRSGGLVTAGRSSFDGRDSYYHLDLDRCAEALADTGAALHPMLRPPVRWRSSAGISPKAALHPEAVRALREGFGIDLAGQSPRPLAAVLDRRFDHVISLCDKAREALTDLPGRPRLAHWSIADPAAAAGAGHRAFRNTAAEIDNRVRHLVPVLAATHPVKEIQP
jgi:protein-tyrosine-phosphatase